MQSLLHLLVVSLKLTQALVLSLQTHAGFQSVTVSSISLPLTVSVSFSHSLSVSLPLTVSVSLSLSQSQCLSPSHSLSVSLPFTKCLSHELNHSPSPYKTVLCLTNHAYADARSCGPMCSLYFTSVARRNGLSPNAVSATLTLTLVKSFDHNHSASCSSVGTASDQKAQYITDTIFSAGSLSVFLQSPREITCITSASMFKIPSTGSHTIIQNAKIPGAHTDRNG